MTLKSLLNTYNEFDNVTIYAMNDEKVLGVTCYFPENSVKEIINNGKDIKGYLLFRYLLDNEVIKTDMSDRRIYVEYEFENDEDEEDRNTLEYNGISEKDFI